MQNLKIQYLKVKDLTPYENNPRDISEDAVAAVAKSIKEFGFKVPVLLDEKGVIIAGHTRKLAAEKLGLEEVPCILINDLSEEQIKAFRIADNKTAEFSAWNEDLLTEELKGLEDLFTGFDENEFNFSQSFLSEREIENSEDLLDKEERVPEVSQVKSSQVKSSQVKSSQVIRLGRNILMQGDATNFNDVKKLINFTGEEKGDLGFTDPPYGINRVHKDGSLGGAHFGKINTYKKVIGDENNSVGLKGLKNLLELTENQIVFGGNYFSEVLPSSQGWEVWDKQNDMEGNDFADCELAWTSFNKRIIIHRFKQNGMIRYGNRKEELLKRIHPNQKLVCLIKDIIVKRKLKTKNIIDIFAGSGSILIAAEELKIPCFCLEIDKEYVEAIAKRWEEFTGQEREVIEDGE